MQLEKLEERDPAKPSTDAPPLFNKTYLFNYLECVRSLQEIHVRAVLFSERSTYSLYQMEQSRHQGPVCTVYHIIAYCRTTVHCCGRLSAFQSFEIFEHHNMCPNVKVEMPSTRLSQRGRKTISLIGRQNQTAVFNLSKKQWVSLRPAQSF